jgi:soluble lytic murein transglycosylase
VRIGSVIPALLLPLAALCGALSCSPSESTRDPARVDARWTRADTMLRVVSSDSAVQRAQAALAAGRPWQATRLVTPALRDRARRTPAAVITAAMAAAGWDGWSEVESLLSKEPWLDTLYAARGRELLARAALARRAPGHADDSVALINARAAVARAGSDFERGVRRVLLARAFDRLRADDSARAAYLSATKELPQVADWLLLRAAVVTPQAAERQTLYGSLQSALARDRSAWAEADARERATDLLGAAEVRASLGDMSGSLRLRLQRLGARDPARDDVRRALRQLVEQRSGTAQARAAIELLDQSFAPLSAAEELAVARSARASGQLARSATGFSYALARGEGTASDRAAYASVLARLGRDADAAAQYALVVPPAASRALAASAAYDRARAQLGAGRTEDARATLRSLLATYPADTAAASGALYLLADLATDDAQDDRARATFRELAARYPTSERAPRARLEAALLALAHGDARTAGLELDSLRDRYPKSPEWLAAGYWSGRAWSSLGVSGTARERWRSVTDSEPMSYYAMTSARRLGTRAWTPPDSDRVLPDEPEANRAAARSALLDRLGLTPEAELETQRLVRDAEAESSPQRLVATARALSAQHDAAGAMRLARRALEKGAPPSAALYRIAYPLGFESTLRAESRKRGLDPMLVAALTKQESSFNPRATSGAGARGLMQLMPPVGKSIALSFGYPTWDPVLLYQPDVNLELGTAHLAEMMSQYGSDVRALAAYNAGGARVARWSRKTGADDAELLIERIPYLETRDYVRILLRDREIYRTIYDR